MNRTLIAIVGFILWSAAVFCAGWAWSDDRSEARESSHRAGLAEDVAAQVQRARQEEHIRGQRMADIGAKHEEDRNAAESLPAAVVADLRDGRLQLRDDLATCSTSLLSQAVAGAVERDAHAELRAEVAGAAVQIGRDADDHVRASQAVVRAYQAEP
ncbi:TPA: lysis protein [Stenotrophomonas maltophilia]|nr:lysis protein [Stenotrophomonas maltophilia]